MPWSNGPHRGHFNSKVVDSNPPAADQLTQRVAIKFLKMTYIVVPFRKEVVRGKNRIKTEVFLSKISSWPRPNAENVY